MKCKICEQEILPGEHVYPGVEEAWHTDCGIGKYDAVMGSDMILRWIHGLYSTVTGMIVGGQERF